MSYLKAEISQVSFNIPMSQINYFLKLNLYLDFHSSFTGVHSQITSSEKNR